MKKIIIAILIITIALGGYYFNSSKKIENSIQINTQDRVEQFNENILTETEGKILIEIDNLESDENEIDAMIDELEKLSF